MNGDGRIRRRGGDGSDHGVGSVQRNIGRGCHGVGVVGGFSALSQHAAATLFYALGTFVVGIDNHGFQGALVRQDLGMKALAVFPPSVEEKTGYQ
jgi:hypothetical protein